MNPDEKKIIRQAVSHRLQNSDAQELTTRDLKSLVSDMVTEELVTRSDKKKTNI